MLCVQFNNDTSLILESQSRPFLIRARKEKKVRVALNQDNVTKDIKCVSNHAYKPPNDRAQWRGGSGASRHSDPIESEVGAQESCGIATSPAADVRPRSNKFFLFCVAYTSLRTIDHATRFRYLVIQIWIYAAQPLLP
jgi:hypothetical protein